jgi:NADPH:quinone reductase-like Zn-dependent oxidoreductase
MKAIVHRDYGPPDVLRYEEIDKPTLEHDQVLIAVRAASVNPLDWRMVRGEPHAIRLMQGLGTPVKRVGRDVAGEVEAVGSDVKRFKPGDAVFGTCRGAFAEYACGRESALALKPDRVTFEQAAAVPVAGLTALQALRDKARVRPGHAVLINGAAGGVGTFAVQLAKAFGADVTGVCSTRNLDFVRSIGADRVIDYTRDDFTQGSWRYDAVLDGVSKSLLACKRVLNPKGIYIGIGAPRRPRVRDIVGRGIATFGLSLFSNRKFILFIAKSRHEDLAVLAEFISAGKVTPVIGKRFKLSEGPDAVRYVEEGHARGKVIVTPD